MGSPAQRRTVEIRLNAIILAVKEGKPRLLTLPKARSSLGQIPAGSLDPSGDSTMELGLRRIVRELVKIELGYVEQLYTFGDIERDPRARVVSVAYLALGRERELDPRGEMEWRNCYELFPWEDLRAGRPRLIDRNIVPVLRQWLKGHPERRLRGDITFGLGGSPWDGTRVLERYELLYEVGLVSEAQRDRGEGARPGLGMPMDVDYRRMVSTALGRIRGKLSYRPVVFELLSESFTLSQLQGVVEALAGVKLHVSNFRRLVERGGLVEETGRSQAVPRGRPAKLFRFRRDVLRERPAPGVGLPGAR